MGYTPPYLEVRKVTGGWSLNPPGATTDDLYIYPNATDTTAYIKLLGTQGLTLGVGGGANNPFSFLDGATIALTIVYTSPDIIVSPLANKNIFLNPTGTGYVKFGTKTGTGDVAIDGHLDIKDSAGNVVKLATVA